MNHFNQLNNFAKDLVKKNLVMDKIVFNSRGIIYDERMMHIKEFEN